MLIHSGGFVGGSPTEMYPIAELAAKKGWIAACIEYRLCKNADCNVPNIMLPLTLDWVNSMQPAAYAAACDANDAFRYLQNNAATYSINPDRMFVGGYSAGAVTTLNVAFLDQNEITTIIPQAGNPNAAMHCLREKLDPPTGVKGVWSIAGGVFNTNWIGTDEKAIPVFMAHGTNDELLEYYRGSFVPCLGLFPTIYGSSDIAYRLKTLGNPYYLHTGVFCGHDVFAANFMNSAIGQGFAFLVKTGLEGTTNIKKHSKHFDCGYFACPIELSNNMAASSKYTIKQGANCDQNFGGGDPASALAMASGDGEADPIEWEIEAEEATGAAQADLLPGEFRLAPNPASDGFARLSAETGAEGEVGIFVFDLLGRTVFSKTAHQPMGAFEFDLDLSGLPGGTYFVHLQSGGELWTQKLEVTAR